MKMIKVNLKLLEDVYELLCESSKIDWEDRVTTRLYKAIKEGKKSLSNQTNNSTD